MCRCWPQTVILLISASCGARITGMSHWCPVWMQFLRKDCRSIYAEIHVNFLKLQELVGHTIRSQINFIRNCWSILQGS
jgi:hypothetical protein